MLRPSLTAAPSSRAFVPDRTASVSRRRPSPAPRGRLGGLELSPCSVFPHESGRYPTSGDGRAIQAVGDDRTTARKGVLGGPDLTLAGRTARPAPGRLFGVLGRSNSPAAAGGGPTRGRPRRSRGGGDELGGRGQLRRREVHERLDAAVRSALRTRPRREQVRKGLRRPVRSSSQSSSSLLGVSGSWSPTCIAGICGRSPARRRAGAASRRTGKRRTATTGGRRSGFRRCRE